MRGMFRYSPGAWRAFGWVFRPRMRMGIHAIRLAGLPRDLPADRPVLLVSNHASWWDGFLLRPLQVVLRPTDRFQVVMLEGELRTRPFLRLLGGVGITPGSATSLRRLLRGFEELRASSPHLTVLFFPQGRIWPTHRRPLGFQEGVRVMARALAPVTVVPVALHLDPGRHPAPSAYISVGETVSVSADEGLDVRLIENRVSGELDRILAFLATWGEEAEVRWPPQPFERLPSVPETLESVS